MRPAANHDDRATERAQRTAADPSACAWVTANAGAGKTHVLKTRVIRLLLAGTPPERILCLTFTKAAAAEMAARVFADLARWATLPDAKLTAELESLLDAAPAPAEILRARRLFALTLETAGGLKIQTIHAFCERLLRRFPLEAGVAPGFDVLDETAARTLQRESIDRTLGAATAAPDGWLAAALETVVTHASDVRFDDLVGRALAARAWLTDMARLDARGDGDAEHDNVPMAAAERLYRAAFGLAADATSQELAARIGELLPADLLREAHALLSTGSANDLKAADRIAAVQAAMTREAKVAAIAAVFLTGEGDPRKTLMTKALAQRQPATLAALETARTLFLALDRDWRACRLVEATVALLRVADAVAQRIASAKSARAALDFDDLIRHAAGLLSHAAAAEWVLFKLDGGLDHILIDEAQDTSPAQWDMIAALAGDFFAGVGGRPEARTLFAVGDEKQSIYGFQGAAPEMFAATGSRLGDVARASGVGWRPVSLTQSFRSAPLLLDAVDRIFADPTRTPGLTAGDAPVAHQPRRLGAAGRVEIWPVERKPEADPVEPWSPLEDGTSMPPAQRVARRVARLIATWLERGERLASEDRPITAGDILILVRRRRPFAPAMVDALKIEGVPVAGADRLRLTDQIMVEDLLALCDVLLLPDDDLQLAAVLKSPIFGLDDGDLMRLAPGRPGLLWDALAAAATEPRYAAIVAALARWSERAERLAPYELLAGLLNGDGLRARLLAHAGIEVAEPIDELLSQALAAERHGPLTLRTFLALMRADAPELKRDLEHGRNAVRVLTVHGAKGLEAPIVFLPDTCAGSRGPSDPLPAAADLRRPLGIGPLRLWALKGASRLAEVAAARAAASAADAAEHNRLLYVALTRARDRIYVAGFAGTKAPPAECWYEKIVGALGERLGSAIAEDGAPVLRLDAPQTGPIETGHKTRKAEAQPMARPEWATRPAPLAAAPRTLQPSALRRGPASVLSVTSPRARAAETWRQRGRLAHALLEHLPASAPAQRRAVGERFLASRAADFTTAERRALLEETLAVLGDATFSAVFAAGSRAEVAFAAEIARPSGGPPLRLNGQIDRLARVGDGVLIVDFKTTRPAPDDPASIPAAYLDQLAGYSLALHALEPDIRVRAAILWTAGPRLAEVPAAILQAHAEALLRDAGAEGPSP